MIPCQPLGRSKAVKLWSKGTEILVNGSRVRSPAPLALSDSSSTPSPWLPTPVAGPAVGARVSQVRSVLAAE